MASYDESGSVHPIATVVCAAREAIADLADMPTWTLDASASRELVKEIAALEAQVAELEARVIGQAEQSGAVAEDGARSVQAWLRHHTKITAGEASRKARLAGVGEQTRSALTRGQLHAEQALVITSAVRELADGDEVTQDDQRRAEKFLVAEAAHVDAHDLRRLGRRILETIDPAAADEHEARLLEKQEARAAKQTRLSMWDDGEGLTHGTFAMPTAQASMLRKALHAHAAPKHVRAVEGAGAYDADKPTPARLGEAFVAYVEGYPADRLPQLGGVAATVVAVVDVAVLTGAAKAALLDTGESISPGQLRRWACSAGILPAVMDGPGKVLDLGRLQRLHSPAQRIAAAIEQVHCQHETCRTPAAFCHLHHRVPWSEGGHTTVRDAVLLCPFHHHQAHTTGQTYPTRI